VILVALPNLGRIVAIMLTMEIIDRVVQRIADYRAEDKADPMYYARLTMGKPIRA
jgi:bifunctional DNase/RNase